MLTPDQLAAIKQRLPQALSFSNCATEAEEDVTLLLAHIERLTRHNQRMSAALAQLSDAENWGNEEGVEYLKPQWRLDYRTAWRGNDDPQQLAERALVEDG